jgi:GWxTD domain-containing protein
MAVCLVLLVLFAGAARQVRNGSQSDQLALEESKDYYRKWTEQDVLYIITEEEKSVFQSLTTAEEKEMFIEQFWRRRDPDPETANNEFKEEHYRRIAYANENFQSGIPGWQTDRGKVYIIHGPPDDIESHPSGGTYRRTFDEGGGTTSTFPFEIWWYRHIEGMGDDIELEFVDRTQSEEYRLALLPEEKDALLYVTGAGLTRAERYGWEKKGDRPYFSPGTNYPYMYKRMKNDPFVRLETYATVRKPKEIKYNDLKQVVQTNITFSSLKFEVQQDYFKLNERQTLVPLTVEIENSELSFGIENDHQVARAAVYGIVSNMTNRVVNEFEDDLSLVYRADQLPGAMRRRSLYQKMITIDTGKRYKLQIVVKDLKSNKVGVKALAIVPPRQDQEKLSVSSVILSDSVLELGDSPREEEMFVLGDIKIYPNLSRQFQREQPFGVYLQIYNAALDQSSFDPHLFVTFKILDGKEEKLLAVDDRGESIRLYGGRRIALLRSFPIEGLEPGRYTLQILIEDRIAGEELVLDESFEILS